MSNSDRDLHGDAYREWRDNRADEFVAVQRRAFLAGFEAAADESRSFRLLREWLEEQRDRSKQIDSEAEEGDRLHRIRVHTLAEVLVKLHEMGCEPEVSDE